MDLQTLLEAVLLAFLVLCLYLDCVELSQDSHVVNLRRFHLDRRLNFDIVLGFCPRCLCLSLLHLALQSLLTILCFSLWLHEVKAKPVSQQDLDDDEFPHQLGIPGRLFMMH